MSQQLGRRLVDHCRRQCPPYANIKAAPQQRVRRRSRQPQMRQRRKVKANLQGQPGQEQEKPIRWIVQARQRIGRERCPAHNRGPPKRKLPILPQRSPREVRVRPVRHRQVRMPCAWRPDPPPWMPHHWPKQDQRKDGKCQLAGHKISASCFRTKRRHRLQIFVRAHIQKTAEAARLGVFYR